MVRDSNVPPVPLAAVVFDMDGVLIDSEQAWSDAREELARETGGSWAPGTQERMMGMSSPEWSRFMRDELGVPLEPSEISQAVVDRLERRYREHLPLLPQARGAVERLAERWPLAIASSSNRPLIDLVLSLARLDGAFRATVSSEEVRRGKPAPDVYLEAARRLGVQPEECVAVEDSTNGITSAAAAGMRVIAVPRPDYPAAPEALARASVVLGSLAQLTPQSVSRAATTA
jgi:HAD superfamily hydrolase (TIGR01509 family)